MEVGWEAVDSFDVVQNGEELCVIVNTAMKLSVP
jgi:hypothetical protein